MRLLFVKTTLGWPRASGHDVYTYYTMKACAELGHDVFLATVKEPSCEALAGLALAGRYVLKGPSPAANAKASWFQHRFRTFWGVSEPVLAALKAAVTESGAEAVIVVGLDALPYFPPLRNVTRVWYPADEWIWHHLSQVRIADKTTWHNVKSAAIKGVYERVHTGVIDRVWVVSESEKRAMRWLAGMKRVDVLPLGVDSEYFRPADIRPRPHSAIFWGRLDFGPNTQALEWFADKVWPLVRSEVPDATFSIVGFNPGPEAHRLAALEGISLEANVPDLREIAHQHTMVVLPLVSGGGMKNKLLEAAALGMPIVCTPLATQGLQGLSEAPFSVATRPKDFADAMLKVWSNDVARRAMGTGSRTWVLKHHSWTATGRRAIAALQVSATDVKS